MVLGELFVFPVNERPAVVYGRWDLELLHDVLTVAMVLVDAVRVDHLPTCLLDVVVICACSRILGILRDLLHQPVQFAAFGHCVIVELVLTIFWLDLSGESVELVDESMVDVATIQLCCLRLASGSRHAAGLALTFDCESTAKRNASLVSSGGRCGRSAKLK